MPNTAVRRTDTKLRSVRRRCVASVLITGYPCRPAVRLTLCDGEPSVRDHTKDDDTLSDLNRNYVRSVDEADTAWFDANLADDFLNTNPDGTLIDRKSFIAQIGRGSSVRNIREHDVIVRIFGDFAIIHARTSYLKPDGTPGAGRYTDDWLFRDGRWQCISAHVSRL
jgi:ketosteroid isomerase-like protein